MDRTRVENTSSDKGLLETQHLYLCKDVENCTAFLYEFSFFMKAEMNFFNILCEHDSSKIKITVPDLI